MRIRLHHAHLFAADLDTTLSWWKTNLAGQVRHDVVFAGARNVFMNVGDGRLHFYDQAPPGPRSAAYTTWACRPTTSTGWSSG